MEYWSSDIAVPESIRALYHFPAWTMIVGQSVLWAIVTVSLLSSPPHVCELGEGSSSLNHPLSQYSVHPSYNILREGCQL